MHVFAAFFALFLPSVASAALLRRRPATVCNGRAELCDRSYGNITFIGSHNSFALSRDAIDPTGNQEVDVISQLNLGVRLLQAESHMWKGRLHFYYPSKYATSEPIYSS